MKYQMSEIIPGMMGMPARLCSIFLFEHFGRKWTMAGSLFQGSFLNLLILFIPSGTPPSPSPCLLSNPSLVPLALSLQQDTLGVSILHLQPTFSAGAQVPPEQALIARALPSLGSGVPKTRHSQLAEAWERVSCLE